MLRKVAFALIAVAAAWLGIRALVNALASDETRIRWKLEEACEGFGDTRMGPILELLAHEFVDQTTGLHREDVRAAVASAFFTQKDPQTRKFPYRAAVVPDSLQISVDPGTEREARVLCTIRITDTTGGSERTAWEFNLDSRMAKGDDGWRLVHTTHDTVKGDPRLR